MLKLIICITGILFSCHAFAEKQNIEAPFGLEWGAQKSSLVGNGINFTECESQGWVEQCQTKSVPKSLSTSDFYLLLFSKKYGLQKVLMLGESISGDIYGTTGKAQYGKLKSALKTKYKTANSYEYVGRKLWDESDEFYQCLAYDGCGNWATYWTDDYQGLIALELLGASRGAGFIKLTYEGQFWERAVDEKNELEDSSDLDAL